MLLQPSTSQRAQPAYKHMTNQVALGMRSTHHHHVLCADASLLGSFAACLLAGSSTDRHDGCAAVLQARH